MAAETDSVHDVDEELPPEEDASREETPEETIARLEAEKAELTEKVLRVQADLQNMRRRSLVDLEAGVKRRLEPMLAELLLVLDYLDLALLSPAEHAETRNLAMGVEMTRAKLVQALQDSDVRPIPTEGTFDPNLHEAAEAVPDEGREPGTILATLRAGYLFGERVLRPARVRVVAEPGAGASETEED